MTGYDYYDSEIIAAVAQKSGMDEKYVEHTLSNHGWQNYTITFSGTIGSSAYMQVSKINLLLEQKKVIEEIAAFASIYITIYMYDDFYIHLWNGRRFFYFKLCWKDSICIG